nr:argininosuccinate lyase [Candidatus Sigynarchaeota archaeon]
MLRNRLSEDLDSIAKAFLSSMEDDKQIVGEDIMGTMAHDYMLYKMDILNLDEIKKILTALMEIYSVFKEGKLNVDDTFEDIHPFIESLVIKKIGMETGGKIHSGRSRNDQVALDIRLKLRGEILDLGQLLLAFMKVLLQRAKAFTNTPFFLYTHLQPAQLGTFGHVLLAWASELARHVERTIQCFERTNLSPLGACAVGGTSFPIDRNMVAEMLGFDGIMENSLDAISSRDVLIEHTSVLASILVFYSRVSEDIILYSSYEFGYLEIPDKFCSVSSVLPQKKNPDTLELIRGNAAYAI